MVKACVVSGLTGQDGSILAEQLLGQGCRVYGLVRRTSDSPNLKCATGLEGNRDLEVVEGDLTDLSSLVRLVELARPHEFYNCGAQSHVGTSFKEPLHTAQVTGLGVLNCLEAIRLSGIHTRFLQWSTSEMFGGMTSEGQNEESPFHPRSPYGVSKLFGYWMVRSYRESYRIFASNLIGFNHESERRGPNFVTRKITLGIAAIKAGRQEKIYLGNLDARRDWGHADDVCRGARMILSHSEPDDFVLATGETHSVREFCEVAFQHAGLGDYRQYVEVDPRFFRPAEVDVLIGDYSKARRVLGWEPQVTFRELVQRMVDHDLRAEGLWRRDGHQCTLGA
jgi:GDPmannose 4,6-dehydratase